jgi:hypothetical protein
MYNSKVRCCCCLKRLGKWGFVTSLIAALPGPPTILRLYETTTQMRSCQLPGVTFFELLAFFLLRLVLALHCRWRIL